MIYTIGHRETYLKLFEEEKHPRKLGRRTGYVGGSVFRTEIEADTYLEERGQRERDVFGVEADWEKDTAPHKGQPYHDLLVDASLVKLSHRDYGRMKLPKGWR